MKKITKFIALLLAVVMVLGVFAGCSEEPKPTTNEPTVFVGKINGVIIPDCIFINYFLGESSEILGKDDIGIDLTASGEKIYTQLEEKGMLDEMVESALEEARKYMVEYIFCSKKSDWLSDDEMKKMKETAVSYVDELNTTYGSYYYGTSSVEEFAQVAYSMTYDDLVEFFTITGALEEYKISLEEKISVSDSQLKEYYETNKKNFYTVEVRHSLIAYEDAEDKDEIAKVKAEAQGYVDKFNAGEMTFDEIVALSDDIDSEGKVNNDGYYTVYQGAGFVDAFEDWGTAQTKAFEKTEVVESEYGCHIMQCTKVYDISDTDVKARVTAAYKTENVTNEIEKEVDSIKDSKEYQISEYNEEHTKMLAKRTFTGEFEKEETEPKEYNDAPMDKTVVAKYKGTDIYQGYYKQYFSQAISEAFADYEDTDRLASIQDEDKYEEALIEALNEEYKDGKTYIEYAREDALELLLEFLASKDMAIDAKYEYTDEEKTEKLSELDKQIDEMLSYYGEMYDCETRDELMQYMAGTNVNGYKEIYINQSMVNDYMTETIEELKVTDDDLVKFYNENEEDYKIITIRIITKNLIDDEGNRFDDKTIKQAETLLNNLKDKIENGDSPEALVEAYSDVADKSKYGLVDLQSSYYTVDKVIYDWASKQTKIGEMAVIEGSASWNLVILEGITTIEKTEGITSDSETVNAEAVKESVTEACKYEKFNESVEKYIADNKLELTDVDYDLIEEIIEEYLTFGGDNSEDEDDSKADSTPVPTAQSTEAPTAENTAAK